MDFYYYSSQFFHFSFTSVKKKNWWIFTGVWVTASLLRAFLNAVVCMVTNSSNLLSESLLIVASALRRIGISVTFMFYRKIQGLLSLSNFCIFIYINSIQHKYHIVAQCASFANKAVSNLICNRGASVFTLTIIIIYRVLIYPNCILLCNEWQDRRSQLWIN